MTFGYVQPFSFAIAPRSTTKVAGIRPGVTEIELTDGRVVRATLNVQDVKPNPQNPGHIDVSFNVVTEVVAQPRVPVMEAHQTVQ